jgi:hypothetical protein
MFFGRYAYLATQHSFLQSSAQAVFSSPAQHACLQSGKHAFVEVESIFEAHSAL